MVNRGLYLLSRSVSRGESPLITQQEYAQACVNDSVAVGCVAVCRRFPLASSCLQLWERNQITAQAIVLF